MTVFLVAFLLPPILAAETLRAYVEALRRNSVRLGTRLAGVPDRVELLPVCSCCRMRALRPAGPGRICPDCDRPEPRHAHPVDPPPPTEGTTGGV